MCDREDYPPHDQPGRCNMVGHAACGCDGDDTPALHRELIRSGVGVSSVRGEVELDAGVIRDEFHGRHPEAHA